MSSPRLKDKFVLTDRLMDKRCLLYVIVAMFGFKDFIDNKLSPIITCMTESSEMICIVHKGVCCRSEQERCYIRQKPLLVTSLSHLPTLTRVLNLARPIALTPLFRNYHKYSRVVE